MSTFEAEIISGKLPEKNIRLETAKKSLEIQPRKLQIFSIGKRTFLDSEESGKIFDLVKTGQRSAYYGNFRSGACIYPRQFWFVEVVVSRFVGINPVLPTVKTSERAKALAKRQYEGVELKGQIENRFLYQTVTGSELVPFGHLKFPLVILPVEKPQEEKTYRIIVGDEAEVRGFSGLTKWLRQVEQIWKEKRAEKSQRKTIYQWLNYSNKLTHQSYQTRFKVLYNSSGTYLVACVAESAPCEIFMDAVTLKSNGLIADYKTFYWDTDNLNEANYLVGFLNSPTIDRLIKPMQSKGDFGERDICKKVLELPIPKYKAKNKTHNRLSNLAKNCGPRVESLIPALDQKYDSLGKIRQLIKQELNDEILEIDDLVKTILLSQSENPKLDKLLK